MKHIISIAALVAACISSQAHAQYHSLQTAREVMKRGAKDGYVFEKPEYVKLKVTVAYVYYQTQEDLIAEYERRSEITSVTYDDGRKPLSFSVLRPKEDYCEIHVIDPRVKYLPERIGHEALHCSMGNWHKKAER